MQDGPLYRIMFNAILRDEERENIVKWICQEADQHKRHMYVLASPAGVYLYAKFDFETVGQIDTGKGVITRYVVGSNANDAGDVFLTFWWIREFQS
ncbi:unnamed protein product [Clonostachys rosea f. rosea IK726]|uniref:Uncharacterized protein n=1 Tax=Clonostachys rosea f. rosea IK726 TaxID=1349383 RepID=A0ACA9TWQ7_BIOOC|nr:unnamed protein product [Clonostachys rosea f. rosea IK726]